MLVIDIIIVYRYFDKLHRTCIIMCVLSLCDNNLLLSNNIISIII